MRRIVVATSLILASLSPAVALPGKPLYEIFKAMCVDTQARPESVKQAIRIADFPIHERNSAAIQTPMHMSGTVWDMVVGIRKLSLTLMHATEPYGKALVRDGDACGVTSWSDDKPSFAALNAWLGRTGEPPPLTLVDFDFENKKPVPFPDQASRKAAEERGNAWRATLSNFGEGGAITLIRYSAPRPRI
jgi:hypothetical protein